MKIAFFELEGWEEKIIKKELSGNQFLFFNEPLSKKHISKIKSCEILSVFIYSNVTKEILKNLPNVKFITTRSTGFEHINVDYCRENKIEVSNVPFYGENTVAEHAFALILSLARNLKEAQIKVLKKDFSLNGLKGFDLKGKTLGVIGTGHIGQNSIKIAKGFGMKILAYDIYKNISLSKELNFIYTNLDYLLKSSDIVTLHIPSTKETHHLLNSKNLNLMKKESLLINTSRGDLIDSTALLHCLNNSLIKVGLDVIEHENMLKNNSITKKNRDLINKILSHKRVIYTPHSAFYTQEALERILLTTTGNISSFINGQPQNTIKPL